MVNFAAVKPKHCLGIYVSRHQVVGVLAEQNDGFIKPVDQYLAEDTKNIFSSKNNENLKDCLEQVLDKFNMQCQGKYIPLQISLADPLVSSAVFDLEEIPEQLKSREQLIRWKFSKERYIDMQQMSIASQSMICEQKQIYACTIHSSIVHTISTACNQKGVMLNVLDAAINYSFNNIYEALPGNASMLLLNQEYWVLMVWNRDKCIRYVRSKWFRSSTMERNEELKEIILDVERLLYSYRTDNEDRPTMLYINHFSYDKSLLQENLLQRFGDDFMFVDQMEAVTFDCDTDAYHLASLAAKYR